MAYYLAILRAVWRMNSVPMDLNKLEGISLILAKTAPPSNPQVAQIICFFNFSTFVQVAVAFFNNLVIPFLQKRLETPEITNEILSNASERTEEELISYSNTSGLSSNENIVRINFIIFSVRNLFHHPQLYNMDFLN